jgi:hypothetical protein
MTVNSADEYKVTDTPTLVVGGGNTRPVSDTGCKEPESIMVFLTPTAADSLSSNLTVPHREELAGCQHPQRYRKGMLTYRVT